MNYKSIHGNCRHQSRRGYGYKPGSVIEDVVRSEKIDKKAQEKQVKNPDNSQDTAMRITIQKEIKKLRDLGFPKEEALKRLQTDFSDSELQSFFEKWIEHAYRPEAKKFEKNKRRFLRGEIDNPSQDLGEER